MPSLVIMCASVNNYEKYNGCWPSLTVLWSVIVYESMKTSQMELGKNIVAAK